MKKMTIALMALVSVLLTGCDTVDSTPSVEKISMISRVVGTTAGYTCELSGTKTEVKNVIVSVVDTVSKVVPETNSTFTVAWTPIIDTEIEKLVSSNKVQVAEGELVKSALKIACSGIDYVFVKYPKARSYENLVSAVVLNFTDGFKSVVTATTKTSAKPMTEEETKISEEFKAYLKSNSK